MYFFSISSVFTCNDKIRSYFRESIGKCRVGELTNWKSAVNVRQRHVWVDFNFRRSLSYGFWMGVLFARQSYKVNTFSNTSSYGTPFFQNAPNLMQIGNKSSSRFWNVDKNRLHFLLMISLSALHIILEFSTREFSTRCTTFKVLEKSYVLQELIVASERWLAS